MGIFGFGKPKEQDQSMASLVSLLPNGVAREQARNALHGYELLGEMPLPQQLLSYKDDARRTIIYETEDEVVPFQMQELFGTPIGEIFPSEVELMTYSGVFRKDSLLATLFCQGERVIALGMTLLPPDQATATAAGVHLSAARHCLDRNFLTRVFGRTTTKNAWPRWEYETAGSFALLCMTPGPTVSFFAFDTKVMNRPHIS